MQEIRNSNPPVVTGICNPNKSRARHHRSLKLGSKLKYLNMAERMDKQDQNFNSSMARLNINRIITFSTDKVSIIISWFFDSYMNICHRLHLNIEGIRGFHNRYQLNKKFLPHLLVTL